MEIDSSEKKFSVAALTVFKRFGVRKATMEEIAAEAGVSKPTLYATFRNKDAALGGAIRLAKNAVLQSVREEWERSEELSDQLAIFLDQLVLAGFDLLHNAPDAAAFDTAVGDSSKEAIKVTRAAEIEAVQTLFEASSSLGNHGFDPQRLARFFVDSAMNAKRLAQSRTELEQHLQTLKAVVLALLEPSLPDATA
ncbi:MAG: TetR/AcrR family transcriptional regulator [Cohaesibacteraceae bacterium]